MVLIATQVNLILTGVSMAYLFFFLGKIFGGKFEPSRWRKHLRVVK